MQAPCRPQKTVSPPGEGLPPLRSGWSADRAEHSWGGVSALRVHDDRRLTRCSLAKGRAQFGTFHARNAWNRDSKQKKMLNMASLYVTWRHLVPGWVACTQCKNPQVGVGPSPREVTVGGLGHVDARGRTRTPPVDETCRFCTFWGRGNQNRTNRTLPGLWTHLLCVDIVWAACFSGLCTFVAKPLFSFNCLPC